MGGDRFGAIVRVPATNALALADAGHQLTAVHGRPGRANSVAPGLGARARATARRRGPVCTENPIGLMT